MARVSLEEKHGAGMRHSGVVAWLLLFASAPVHAEQAPNIVLVLSDDQGWNGTSVQMDPNVPGSRSDFYQTPRLEELALSGMRFANGYSSASVCAPTRAAIQTGMSVAQLQMPDLPHATPGSSRWSRYERLALIGTAPEPFDPGLLTLPKMIHQANANYVTAHFGKWHLDSPPGGNPILSGYDIEDDMLPLPLDEVDPWGVFATANLAGSFMEEQVNNNQPFFMQLSHRAVHEPIRSRQVIREKYEMLPPGIVHNDPAYAAETEDLDTSIGMVLDKIAELGIEDNTYVIYVSDNGATPQFSSNGPLARGKSTLGEGGIRVPFIIRGPNVAASSVSQVPVTTTDLYSTIADLVGHVGPLPASIEGASLVPLLHNSGQLPAGMDHLARNHHEGGELYWHKPVYSGIAASPESVVRDGEFKLNVKYGTYGQPNQYFLYNLSTDISEQVNLAESMPEQVEELKVKLEKYLAAIDASLAFDVAADVEMEWDASQPGEDQKEWRSTINLDYKGRETWKLDDTLGQPQRVGVETFQLGLPRHAFKFDGGDQMHRLFFQVGDDGQKKDTPDLNAADFDRSATMEFWVRLDTLTQEQILFESGGGDDGISVTLGDADSDGLTNDVRFRVQGFTGPDGGDRDLPPQALTVTAKIDRFADPEQDFLHLVTVFNDDPADRYAEIYVNGALAKRVNGLQGIENSLQWDGYDEAGLGNVGGSELGANSGSGDLPFSGGFQGEMALVRFRNHAIFSNEVANSYSSALGPADFNIESMEGDVDVPADRPTNVSLGEFESSNLMVLHERGDTLDDPLSVDAIISGATLLTNSSGISPGQLDVGTSFSSFLIQFDPLGTDGESIESVLGSISFQGEILALLLDSTSLASADPTVGSIGDYGDVADRGITLGTHGALFVSSDQRTLEFLLTAPGDEMLQFRVLTQLIRETDFNADGLVDSADLSIWESAYGLTGDGDADRDGDTDGTDFLLWQQQYVDAAPAPGDFDGDRDVDGADLALWEIAYGLDGTADADGDGDSDGADFLAWQRNSGMGAASLAALQRVPEPATAVLGLFALISVLNAHRRARRVDCVHRTTILGGVT